MSAVKNAFFDEINAEPCVDCDTPTKEADADPDALEAYGEVRCTSCAENRRENAYQAQFEGEPPLSADERHAAAWAEHLEAHR